MWKLARHVIQLNGCGPATVSLFLFGGALALAASTPGTDKLLTFFRYSIPLTALLVVLLAAAACKPEDTPRLETQAALPRPLWQIVATTIAVDWVTILLTITLVSLLAAVLLDHGDLRLLRLGLPAAIAGSLFFGGMTLFGTALGRSSQAGLLLGLLLASIPLIGPFPGPVSLALHPYIVVDGMELDPVWWMSRLAYASLGIIACVLGISWLRNTDRLLTGAHFRLARPLSREEPSSQRTISRTRLPSVLARILPGPAAKILGLVAYETTLATRAGPLLILGVCVALGGTILLPGLFQDSQGMLVDQLASIPSTLCYLLFLLLPFIFSDTIPADRRAGLDQLLLATISPQWYLWGKVLGVCGAVLISTLLGNLLLLLLVAIQIPPSILLLYTGLLFVGIIPALMYVSALSVLGGALTGPRRPLFVGAVLTVGALTLLFVTRDSLLGNILFPTGMMASTTISNLMTQWLSAWLLQHGGVPIYVSPPPRLVMPLPWLLLPPISATLQVGLAWTLVRRVFEKEITKQ